MSDSGRFPLSSRASGGLTSLVLLASATLAAAQDVPSKSAEKPKADLPAAKEVIARFIEVTGGRAARLKHKSRHFRGRVNMPASGRFGSLDVYAAMPNRFMLKTELTGVGVTRQGFDGKIAWAIHPIMGPSILEGVELEQKRLESEYHRELDKAKLFQSIETVELTEFDGIKCYKVKLVPKTSPPIYEFYEVGSGLRRGTQGVGVMALGELPITNIATEYKKFDGVMFATRMVQKVAKQEIVMKIESVAFDKTPDSIFELPAEIKALVEERKAKPKGERP